MKSLTVVNTEEDINKASKHITFFPSLIFSRRNYVNQRLKKSRFVFVFNCLFFQKRLIRFVNDLNFQKPQFR